MTGSPIVVALDFADRDAAEALVRQLRPDLCRLKVGFELFLRAGPAFVQELGARGYDVFLDLKIHDIPNTCAAACRAAADLGVWMVNVHASGGAAMLEAARQSLQGHPRRPYLIGVTLLTSLDQQDMVDLGFSDGPGEQTARLARLALGAGLDGVVCSPREVAALRESFGPGPVLVTPGVRSSDQVAGDQKRVATPVQALAAGSDYLVVGRPVTRAPQPLEALEAIYRAVV